MLKIIGSKILTSLKGILIPAALLTSMKAFSQSETKQTTDVLTFNIGSVMSSYKENEDKLETTDGTTGNKSEPYSGSASSLDLDVMYEHYFSINKSWYLRGMGPIMGSTPDRYFSAGGGMNYYFGPIATRTIIKDEGFELKIEPKMRYYAGGSIGLGYLTYNTKSATKGDVLLELGGQGGIIYPIDRKYGVRGELGLMRSIGVLVASTEIKIFLGVTVNIGVN